jgi:hypothetical protein
MVCEAGQENDLSIAPVATMDLNDSPNYRSQLKRLPLCLSDCIHIFGHQTKATALNFRNFRPKPFFKSVVFFYLVEEMSNRTKVVAPSNAFYS